MTTRTYDIVIWGATGFTGRLVMAYMAKTYGVDGEIKWAVAGRNAAKLADVKREVLGADAEKLPEVIADSNDEASLRTLVSDTKVVCTTVGPYALYGSTLVALCAELGTHYCDLTGEVQWMHQMIEAHQVTAEASGARIVHTCGFDSIPSDLGTYFVQREMHKTHGVYAPQVKYRVVGSSGGVSGGTVASMMNMMEEASANPEILDIIADPYALNPPNLPRGEDGADQTAVEYDQDFRQWTGPFVMAGINTRVVRRSHALLGYPWGSHFRYDEAILTGDGPSGFAKAVLVAGGTGLMSKVTGIEAFRKLLGRLVPAPGEGPSVADMEKGFFEIELRASNPEHPKKALTAVVTGDRDPGYGSTCKMIAESAVCLAVDDLESAGGFLTPASAMGDLLIARLAEKAGMGFALKAAEE
ncbi:MAG: saccharopine dehydrogenase NADP-binding domain-containing protein [Pseudomonadales bacterium]|nr:saccharopine dehydrogenase NADP-binding domain-containing protein [Pseudomonadales bacterium]